MQYKINYTKGPSINVDIFRSVKAIHFPPPPKKKSTHQHFLSAKNPHENNKNQAKSVRKFFLFSQTPTLTPSAQKCMAYTLMKILTFMDGH